MEAQQANNGVLYLRSDALSEAMLQDAGIRGCLPAAAGGRPPPFCLAGTVEAVTLVSSLDLMKTWPFDQVASLGSNQFGSDLSSNVFTCS